MQITIKFDVHCFKRDRLVDNTFDSLSINLIGKHEAEKIKKNRYKVFDFSYDHDTTLGDFKEKVLSELFDYEDWCCALKIRIVGKNQWTFFIDDINAKFENILNDDLIPVHNNSILVKIFVSFDAADYDRDNRLRYYMHSNENGLEPHIHVDVLGEECSVSIPINHPEDYTGKIPNKYLKKALSKVKEEKDKMLEFWNLKTNGLRVDINQSLGIIDCIQEDEKCF